MTWSFRKILLFIVNSTVKVFKGFFRDFDCRIDFQSTTVRNSWRVYNTDGTGIQDFADIGSNTSSTLNYRSPFSSEKYIEIYTNPAIITYLALNNCSIQEIPKSRLTALETFNFSTNGLVEFPNLLFFSPNLKFLDITNNPFFNGSDPDQRYFSSKIVAKLPATLQTLAISGCFKGAFVQNQLNKFTSLTSINANRSGFNTTSFFYPDSKNPTGELPNFYGIAGNDASQVISSVNLYNNDFRTITPGIQGGVDVGTRVATGQPIDPNVINSAIGMLKAKMGSGDSQLYMKAMAYLIDIRDGHQDINPEVVGKGAIDLGKSALSIIEDYKRSTDSDFAQYASSSIREGANYVGAEITKMGSVDSVKLFIK